MRPRIVIVAAVIAFVLAVALGGAAGAQGTSSGGRVPLGKSRTLGAPRTFRNLTLIPVYDTAARSAVAYMTLDEGLRAKQVQVKEIGSGDVNTLLLTNTGRKPLYVMAGEVVLGGQQDRCLAQDTILPPGKRNVPVTVFCVEHGRWQGKTHFDRSAQTVASGEIRASAQEGAFEPSAGVAAGYPGSVAQQPASVRAGRGDYGSVARAQQSVWDKVARKNARFGAAPSDGSYRAVLNTTGGETGRSIAPYLKALSGSLKPDPHLVGVVVAVNGKPVTADIFGDPVLFRKLWPKLLRSYATDAAEGANKQNIKPVAPEQARAFLVQALDAQSKVENQSADGRTLRLESRDSLTYRLVPRAEPAASGPALHENVLRK